MSIRVMSAMFAAEGLTASEKIVGLALADHAHDDGSEARPGIMGLSKKCALSERQVQRILRDLEVKKVIIVQREATRHDPRWYRFLLDEHGALAFRGDMVTPLEKFRGDICDGLGVTSATSRGDMGVTLIINKPSNESLPSSPDGDGERKNKKNEYTPEFEEIWKLYPKRKGKLPSFKAFKARLKQGVSSEDLLSAVKNYAAEKAGIEERFLLNGETFFGPNEKWLDYSGVSESEEFSADSKSVAMIFDCYDAGEEWYDAEAGDATFANPSSRGYTRPVNRQGQLIDSDGSPYRLDAQGMRRSVER